MVESAPTQRLSGLVVLLLFSLWLFATPVLLWNAMWNTIALFGETPSPAQLAMARWQALGALLTGLGAPSVGLWLAVRARDTALRWLFGVVLAVTVVAGVGGAWFLSVN